MKKVIFIVVVSQIIIYMVYAVVNYRFYTTYCKDYYSIVTNTDTDSVPYIKSFNIEDIMEANGTPEDEWEEERENNYSFKYLQYEDGRLFCFSGQLYGKYQLARVEITGDNYRFGKKQIGIGTDKELIEQVYKDSYFLNKNSVVNEEVKWYINDGNYDVTICFDEGNKVNKIIIGEAEIFYGFSGWKERSWDRD